MLTFKREFSSRFYPWKAENCYMWAFIVETQFVFAPQAVFHWRLYYNQNQLLVHTPGLYESFSLAFFFYFVCKIDESTNKKLNLIILSMKTSIHVCTYRQSNAFYPNPSISMLQNIVHYIVSSILFLLFIILFIIFIVYYMSYGSITSHFLWICKDLFGFIAIEKLFLSAGKEISVSQRAAIGKTCSCVL